MLDMLIVWYGECFGAAYLAVDSKGYYAIARRSCQNEGGSDDPDKGMDLEVSARA